MKVLKKSNYSTRSFEYIILLLIIALSFIVRFTLVNNNLPVCNHLDERTGLEVLYRFENINLNPGFFHYPTFYYYLTFFLLKPLPFKDILFYGRILNLLFGCVLAVSVFFISKQIFKSGETGLFASALTMFSPIIIINASYIITDILLAIFSILSLFFLFKFFENYKHIYWFLGVLFIGLAISTKYTAIVIAISYVIFEFSSTKLAPINLEKSNFVSNLLYFRLRPNYMSSLLFLSAISFIMIFLFFPEKFLFSIFKTSGDLNSVVNNKDIQFLHYLKGKFLLFGIGMMIFAFILFHFKKFSERFCTIRPYIALFLISIFYLLGSPYSLISWKTFLYDFGAEIKTNALNPESAYWIQYMKWFFQHESIIILIFFFVGIYFALRQKKNIMLFIIVIIVFYITIGSSHRGYTKYLTPILPVIFMISAWGIYATGILLKRYRRRIKDVFLIIVVVFVGLELFPKVSSMMSQIPDKNEMYQSYIFTTKLHPDKIYFSGNVPHVELKMRNINVEEVPKKWLNEMNLCFLQVIKPNEILLLDRKTKEVLNELVQRNLKLLWSSDKGYGQYIYKKEKQDTEKITVANST